MGCPLCSLPGLVLYLSGISLAAASIITGIQALILPSLALVVLAYFIPSRLAGKSCKIDRSQTNEKEQG